MNRRLIRARRAVGVALVVTFLAGGCAWIWPPKFDPEDVLDHFLCYYVTPEFNGPDITLKDQFPIEPKVIHAETNIDHFKCYLPKPASLTLNIPVHLKDQFLELLKEVVPGLTRVAVFVNTESANAPPQIKSAEEAARRLGIEVRPIMPIRSPGELEKAFEAATKAHASAAIRMIDPLVLMLRKATAALAAKHRLPVIYPSREDVEAGGLIAYGANAPEQFRQAAGLVDKC